MTAHYARLTQQTVRRHWEAARKVGITGELTVETAAPLADAVWLKNGLSRAKGAAQRPLHTAATADLRVRERLPDVPDVPHYLRALLEHAEQHDQQRVLQMNRTVEANLLAIIASLEQSTHGLSGCCSAGGEPSGCGG